MGRKGVRSGDEIPAGLAGVFFGFDSFKSDVRPAIVAFDPDAVMDQGLASEIVPT